MGQVEHWFQKYAAEQDVRLLWGVIGVSNQIMIKPTVDAAGQRQHQACPAPVVVLRSGHIKVHTNGGTIRLSGTAHSPHDRQTAVETAWSAWSAYRATAVENDMAIG